MTTDLSRLKGSSGWAFWLILAAIAALGVIQVSLFLDRSLTIDEPFTANVVQLDRPQMIEMVWRHETPLYHVLLKAWVTLFGESEIALRSFSVFCFCMAIIIIGYTTKRLGSMRAGWTAAFLMSISYLGLHHAGTARMYALLGLQIAIATLLSYRFLELNTSDILTSLKGQQVLLCVLLLGVNLTGLLTHSLYIIFLVTNSVVILVLSWRAFRVFALCSLFSLAIHFGIWGDQIIELVRLPATEWMQVPVLDDLRIGISRLWGNWRTYLLVAYILAVSFFRRQMTRKLVRDQQILYSGLNLILLIILPFLVSQFRPIYFSARTPALFLPMACVLVGLIVSRVGEARSSIVVLAVLGLGSLWTCAVAPPEELGAGPSRSSVFTVVEKAKCGDILISGELAINEVAYYLRQSDDQGCLEHLVFPASQLEHPGWLGKLGWPESRESLAREASQLVGRISEQNPESTVWLFYNSRARHRGIVDILKQEMDQRMVSTEVLYLQGSFFDRVLVYTYFGGDCLVSSEITRWFSKH